MAPPRMLTAFAATAAVLASFAAVERTWAIPDCPDTSQKIAITETCACVGKTCSFSGSDSGSTNDQYCGTASGGGHMCYSMPVACVSGANALSGNEKCACGSKVCDEGKPICDVASIACSTPHCVGAWGSCGSNCQQTFTISSPAREGGDACPQANGATQSCTGGSCVPNCTYTDREASNLSLIHI